MLVFFHLLVECGMLAFGNDIIGKTLDVKGAVMKKYSAVIVLVILFLILLAWMIPADAAIYRSSDEDDQTRTRKAVAMIDMGRVKDAAYSLHYFTLVCVDGVKIYTVETSGDSINSFVIPGRCDGQPEPQVKPKVIYIPTPGTPQPKKAPEDKEDFLKW